MYYHYFPQTLSREGLIICCKSKARKTGGKKLSKTPKCLLRTTTLYKFILSSPWATPQNWTVFPQHSKEPFWPSSLLFLPFQKCTESLVTAFRNWVQAPTGKTSTGLRAGPGILAAEQGLCGQTEPGNREQGTSRKELRDHIRHFTCSLEGSPRGKEKGYKGFVCGWHSCVGNGARWEWHCFSSTKAANICTVLSWLKQIPKHFIRQ